VVPKAKRRKRALDAISIVSEEWESGEETTPIGMGKGKDDSQQKMDMHHLN
jgi:hypothetical protein